MKGSRCERFQMLRVARLVPATCPRALLPRLVLAVCSRDLLPRFVPATCSRGLFPRLVPATCKRNPTQPNEAMRPNATQRNQMKPTATKYKKCDQARLIFSGSLQPPEKMLGVPNCEMFRMPHVEGSRVYQVSNIKYQVVVVKTL